jgi:quercetin dioxygenase-like cupin family protein
MRLQSALWMLVLGASSAWAQNKVSADGNPVPVPIAEEPHHHLVMENSYVRVFAVELPPQKSTELHQHDYDYVIVTLTDGIVESGRNGKSPVIAHNYTKGDTRYFHGPATRLFRNSEGATTHRDITVEIKRKSDQPYGYFRSDELSADYSVVPPPLDGLHTYTTTRDRDTVRMSEVQILPGENWKAPKGEFPFLVIAENDLELRDAKDRNADPLRIKETGVAWSPAVFRTPLVNASSQPAHFVLLEFK